MDDGLVFEALRRGLITPEQAKDKLTSSSQVIPPPLPANGGGDDDGPPPGATGEKTLGNTFLSGIKAAGAGAIGTMANVIDPTPMFGVERPHNPMVPDLSATKNAAATVVDKQRQNYQDDLVGQGLGYATEAVANPINYVGGEGAAVAKEAGSAITGLGRNIAARFVQGGAEGANQGVGTDDSRLTNAGIGAGGAAALTGLVGAGKGFANAVVPEISKETATLAQRAKDFGIPLSVQQVAPTKIRNTTQKMSSAIPLNGVQGFEDAQRAAFNKAVAGTLGEDADNLGPDTIKNFLDRTSTGFDDVLKDKTITIAPESLKAFDNIAADAHLSLTTDLANVVSRNVDKLKADIGDGSLSGDKLASFRSELVKRIPGAQGEAKHYLTDVVNEIDGIAENALGPEAQQQLSGLRNQWRNFKTVEPLLEKSTEGSINPTDLMQRVASSKFIKNSRSAVGDDDLVDLARIGKQLLVKQGGSDTASNLTLGAGIGSVPTALLAGGALAAAKTGGLALGGIALNRAFQSFYNQSPRVVEAAIKKSLGSGSDAAINLIKKGAPLDVVAKSLKSSGASADAVDSVIQEITKDLPATTNPSSQLRSNIIKKTGY